MLICIDWLEPQSAIRDFPSISSLRVVDFFLYDSIKVLLSCKQNLACLFNAETFIANFCGSSELVSDSVQKLVNENTVLFSLHCLLGSKYHGVIAVDEVHLDLNRDRDVRVAEILNGNRLNLRVELRDLVL